MATVFRATDERNGQEVAVKMMAPGYLSRKDMALRFRREFRAIQRLSHPNIVRVLECGAASGRFYFPLELSDGGDLAGYRLRYGTDGVSFDEQLDVPNPAAVSREVSGLAVGTTYFFVVQAYDDSLNLSPYSDVASATVAPSAGAS